MAYHGKTIWLTGLSGAGKTTIAKEVGHYLRSQGMGAVVLDADELRPKLWPELGYSQEDREENVNRFAHLAENLNTQGETAIVAVISPTDKMRAAARRIIGKEHFIEIFVDASLEVCMERDPKGLYKRAAEGKIEDFTGVAQTKAAQYERPRNPFARIKTNEMSIEESAQEVFQALLRHH